MCYPIIGIISIHFQKASRATLFAHRSVLPNWAVSLCAPCHGEINTRHLPSHRYYRCVLPMTNDPKDKPVSREEFEAVSDQVGRLTEKVTELQQDLKEIKEALKELKDKEKKDGK